MNYTNEFRLLSSKHITSHQEMKPDEISLYKMVFDRKMITDDRQIFRPQYGMEYSLYDEELFINELCVRQWRWKSQTLLELTTIFDEIPYTKLLIQHNDNYSLLCEGVSDEILEFVNTGTEFADFSDRVITFSYLIWLQPIKHRAGEENTEIKEYINEFYTTTAGKDMLQIEQDAINKYFERNESKHEEEKRLRSLYLNEFCVLHQNVILPAEYEAEWKCQHPQLWQRRHKRTGCCTIMQWRSKYLLIYVNDCFQNDNECVYLVQDEKLFQVFTDWYLMPVPDNMHDIFGALQERVHTIHQLAMERYLV